MIEDAEAGLASRPERGPATSSSHERHPDHHRPVDSPAAGSDSLAGLGTLLGPVQARLERMAREDVVGRIWRGDYTVWSDDPTEITQPNRLGWLTVASQMRPALARLEEMAEEARRDGMETLVLLGMGGSSLAPEVLFRTLAGPRSLRLELLDTTVPDDILRVERAVDMAKTLFVVASKSGTTLETASQLAYFWDLLPYGRHFIAVTDPGTPLQAIAQERGFRRLFLNPESIGGRYSALSYFGLVPGALLDVNLATLLHRAVEMQQACRAELPPSENPGARLGAALGEAALAGRDKVTLVLPPEMASLGDWLEQLLAESTGKQGRGIIPISGEPIGDPGLYGHDRLFVALSPEPGLDRLTAAGQPILRLPYEGRTDLGAQFYLWEFATAVAGYVLHINPFDQPNVQEAKDAANRVLASGSFELPETAPLPEVLGSIGPGDYVALLAYLPRTPEVQGRLEALRLRLRQRFHVATTSGFGPRYLHSTGQVHKGGPNSGVFLVLTAPDEHDLRIPGRDFSFGKLKQAQARGDLESLLAAGRRATATTLDKLEEALR
jgi:glucose-6-phosphate isomerase